jgi:hypothetical protein
MRAAIAWAARRRVPVAVVTSFAFRTVPADDLTCFKLVWPHAHAAALIESWQTWAPSATDELAASLLLNASADP